MYPSRLHYRMPESWENVGFTDWPGAWERQKTGDKIIHAAGYARAAFFVCAKTEPTGNLLEGGELLRKVLVYVCKPDRLVMQASFKYNEECSC